MIRLERSITIEAAPGRIFALVGDPKRYTEFFVGITNWEPRSRKRRGVGALYRVLMKVGSIEAGGTVRVTEWEERKSIKWKSEQGVRQEGRWRLTEVKDGTKLTLGVSFDLSGGPVGRLVEQLAGRIVGRNMWATLLAVRRLVELED